MRGVDLERKVDMKRHTQKYIFDHLECEGQMDISDFPEFCPSDVDNSVTNVDNITEPICTIFECVRCSLAKFCYPHDNA